MLAHAYSNGGRIKSNCCCYLFVFSILSSVYRIPLHPLLPSALLFRREYEPHFTSFTICFIRFHPRSSSDPPLKSGICPGAPQFLRSFYCKMLFRIIINNYITHSVQARIKPSAGPKATIVKIAFHTTFENKFYLYEKNAFQIILVNSCFPIIYLSIFFWSIKC